MVILITKICSLADCDGISDLDELTGGSNPNDPDDVPTTPTNTDRTPYGVIGVIAFLGLATAFYKKNK